MQVQERRVVAGRRMRRRASAASRSRLVARSRTLLHSERGAIAVITAVVMVSLLGMLALVVDVGYAYGQRRMAQNTADSGAMAAAKVLAHQQQAGGETDQDVLRAIRDVARKSSGGFTSLVSGSYTDQFTAVYVDSSGAPLSPSVTVGSLGTAPPPAAARGVSVTPAKTFATFFAGVLGHATMGVGARATSLTKTVTGLAPGLYGPYAIWGGENADNCTPGNGFHGGCNLLGTTVNYRCNNWANCNVHDGASRWTVTSNTFKGYLHLSNGFLTIDGASNDDLQGGNSVGTAGEPLAQLEDCYNKRGAPYFCTVVIPIVDNGTDSGTGITLHVVGFASVKLTNDPVVLPPSQPWQGVIVPGSLTYNGGLATTSGTPPSPGVPSVQIVGLTQ